MIARIVGTVALLGGVVIVIVSAAADSVGLSGTGSEGWGTRQTTGIVIGLVFILAGWAVLVWGRRRA